MTDKLKDTTLAEELMKDKFEEKEKLAQAIGEKRVNNLIINLSKSGRLDDIVKAAKDEKYQRKLFEEFGL